MSCYSAPPFWCYNYQFLSFDRNYFPTVIENRVLEPGVIGVDSFWGLSGWLTASRAFPVCLPQPGSPLFLSGRQPYWVKPHLRISFLHHPFRSPVSTQSHPEVVGVRTSSEEPVWRGHSPLQLPLRGLLLFRMWKHLEEITPQDLVFSLFAEITTSVTQSCDNE